VTAALSLHRLSEDQIAIRDAGPDARAREGCPRAAEIDRTAEFPEDLRQLLAKQGILGLPFPERFGGLGGQLLTVILAGPKNSQPPARRPV